MTNTKSFNGAEIIDSCSLLAFGCQHGELSTQACKDAAGNSYLMLVFTEPATGKDTYVSISEKIADKVNDQYLINNIDNLQVVQLSVDEAVAAERAANNRQAESFMLCTKGQGTRKKVALDFRALAGLR